MKLALERNCLYDLHDFFFEKMPLAFWFVFGVSNLKVFELTTNIGISQKRHIGVPKPSQPIASMYGIFTYILP